MPHEQASSNKPENLVIKPFEWQDWDAMWTLRRHQLADDGVFLDGPIPPPDFTIVYDEANRSYHEIDMDRIDQCYRKGRGNFWIAWLEGQPAGYVGAQDMGDFIELRRMYVRKEYRRRKIGSMLVQSLLDHCQSQKVERVKLWTGAGGAGCRLYATFGFRQVSLQDVEVNTPSALDGEIRMCLDLIGENEKQRRPVTVYRSSNV